ncbi:MAG: hypothetical protein IPG03_14140 [Candidatus Microthrix sp.]|nr:hypothetical protein [Candidatus Microthrix sp.]MBK6503439.1 hypothetical protein [Candidatus Microthrix sp.]
MHRPATLAMLDVAAKFGDLIINESGGAQHVVEWQIRSHRRKGQFRQFV